MKYSEIILPSLGRYNFDGSIFPYAKIIRKYTTITSGQPLFAKHFLQHFLQKNILENITEVRIEHFLYATHTIQ